MPDAARYRCELSMVRHRDRCFLGEHGAAMSEAALLSLSFMLYGLLLGCPSYEGGATPSVPGVIHTIHAIRNLRKRYNKGSVANNVNGVCGYCNTFRRKRVWAEMLRALDGLRLHFSKTFEGRSSSKIYIKKKSDTGYENFIVRK